MLMRDERELLVEYGRKLIKSDLTKGTGGNISIYDREEGLIAITPSGLDYFETKPEDIIIVDIDGKIVEGDRKPSSELEMHRIFYEKREDIDALVHTHSTYAATLACLGWDLPAVHYLVALAGPDVRCADYASYGTDELAKNAFKFMEDRKAVILANHGMLAGSYNLEDAFNIAEEIEFCCELYYRTKCLGQPNILDAEEMESMLERFDTYGHIRR